jgi:dihydrofolate reductase
VSGRRIIAYLATSVDGFIARPNGAVDWLDRPQPKGGYGMAKFMRGVDTLVMGRATYEVGKKLGQPIWPGKRNIIVSRTLAAVPDAEMWRASVSRLAKRLRAEPNGGNVWLLGGAKLFAGFLDANELDDLIVHVVPVVIGEGIPLFTPKKRTRELTLRATKRFSDGIVRLDYTASP